MAIIDISNNSESQEKTYLSYRMSENTLELAVIAVKETQTVYSLNLTKENSMLKKWAQNLQQSPEKYLEQFYISLHEKSLDDNEVNDKVQIKNLFEFNEESLIWKQYFCDKKMFGRKGKFTLEKVGMKNMIEQIFDKIVNDFRSKDKMIINLEKENKAILSEKNELLAITEKSVKIKEKLEKDLYGKFAILLNAKKEKLSKFKTELCEFKEQSQSGQSSVKSKAQMSMVELENSEISSFVQKTYETKNLSDDEYEDDTDVDSPHEIDRDNIVASKKSVSFKRKDVAALPVNTSFHDITKDRTSSFDDSQDLLNASLEMESEQQFSNSKFKKFKNV